MSERLVLIDGHSMIFRAYFAIPGNLRTRSGLHTNAIYGFTTMFKKLLSGRTPDRGAVVFDPPGRSFRVEQYADYKAQRPGMADDLREQLPWIDRVVEAHRFRTLRLEGFEADDVIGTLTRRALEAGMEVVIVSADKDFAQLVTDRVKVLDAIRDVTYDPELVRKKWGVRPSQFVDYLALVGDKVDNIPGVPGVGQKSAVALLEKYQTLPGILEHLTQIGGKTARCLEEHREQALLSQDLATIHQHVPLEVPLEDLRYTPPDARQLNDLYRELEFFSLLQEGARDELAREEEGDALYCELRSATELEQALARLGEGPVALQPLYNRPAPITGEWVGLAFSDRPGHACYAPLTEETSPLLRSFLEDEQRPKVAHDAKQLILLAKRYGLELRGLVGDTRLASFLVEPARAMPHELPQVSREYLHRTVRSLKSLTGTGKKERPVSEAPSADACAFACHLVDAVGQLWSVLEGRLEQASMTEQLLRRDLPLSYVLADMELRGLRVDPEDLARLGTDLREQLHQLERTIFRLAGREFNVGSPKQLGEVLFDELRLPVLKRTKTGYSTDAEVLERLAGQHEIARHLLEQRKLSKLIHTYTDVLQQAVHPGTGRVHCTFQQTTGATGRLITTDPDLQRTPIRSPEGRRIRRSFVPEPGWRMISADWSQIELRVLAHYSDDEQLLQAFREGLDIHRRTASQLFGCEPDQVAREQREIAKTVNFATIYGQGATALGQILGIPRKEAQGYIDAYFKAYAGVRAWLDETIERALRDGYVTTLLGRRRYIPELHSKNFVDQQTGQRIAANTPIQGSAADICKLAMLDIAGDLERRSMETRMLLQIHDELLFESPPDEVEIALERIRHHMEHCYELKVPLVVEIGVGSNWSEAH